MIRIAVLPYARPGITGGAMLGLGRAIGETIAVVLVIGDAPMIGNHLFNQGYTLAAVIANEFGEAASTPIHSSALFAAGLVLFVLTLIVNIIARYFVVRGARRRSRDRRDVVVRPRPPPMGEVGMSTIVHSLPEISARRRRDRQGDARATIARGDADRARPADPDHLLRAQEGPERLELELLLDRSRTGTSSATRAGSGARSSVRSRWSLLATLISIPIGIGVALYLVEYGKDSAFANVVRYFIDVMTGVPSIVFGLFIYIVLVISHAGGCRSPPGKAPWRCRC